LALSLAAIGNIQNLLVEKRTGLQNHGPVLVAHS
jgi:hypothetical protein